VSGGGGGLLLDKREPYQFVEVTVGPNQVDYENIEIHEPLGTFREKLETLKLFLHSFFYMSLINALLVLCIISLIMLKLYSLILRQEHLYRDDTLTQMYDHYAYF